jgi:gamma-glutamyltranspeptidase/glutathione hydrolase
VIRGAIAVASDEQAAEAANEALQRGGSAVDAVVAAFVTAAGNDPEVLLAPVIALVVGPGHGARAFDGRLAQPGLGAARPRGYLDEASAPLAARLGVPRSIAMLALLHTYGCRLPLRDLVRPGALAAEKRGAVRRAAILVRLGEAGAMLLTSRELEMALLAAGGPVAGGLLTAQDLAQARPADADARRLDTEVGFIALAPWESASSPAETSALTIRGAAAADARGGLAALSYVAATPGVALPEAELVASPLAVPVRRGIPRVTPGTALAAPAPIAILVGSDTGIAMVLEGGASRVDPDALGDLIGGAAGEAAFARVAARHGAEGASAAVRVGRDARGIRVRSGNG